MINKNTWIYLFVSEWVAKVRSHTAYIDRPEWFWVDLYQAVKAWSEVDHLRAFPVSGHTKNITLRMLV